MNKLVINLEEVRKFKSRSIECFTSLNIYDCLKYYVHQNINKLECNKCHNKNCESLCAINSPPEILTIILHYNENFGDDILFNIYPQENSDDLNIK